MQRTDNDTDFDALVPGERTRGVPARDDISAPNDPATCSRLSVLWLKTFGRTAPYARPGYMYYKKFDYDKAWAEAERIIAAGHEEAAGRALSLRLTPEARRATLLFDGTVRDLPSGCREG